MIMDDPSVDRTIGIALDDDAEVTSVMTANANAIFFTMSRSSIAKFLGCEFDTGLCLVDCLLD